MSKPEIDSREKKTASLIVAIFADKIIHSISHLISAYASTKCSACFDENDTDNELKKSRERERERKPNIKGQSKNQMAPVLRTAKRQFFNLPSMC